MTALRFFSLSSTSWSRIFLFAPIFFRFNSWRYLQLNSNQVGLAINMTSKTQNCGVKFHNDAKMLKNLYFSVSVMSLLFSILYDYIFHQNEIRMSYQAILRLWVGAFRMTCTAKTKYRNFETNNPRKGISGSQSQFLHSCIYERFIYSNDRSAYSARGNI